MSRPRKVPAGLLLGALLTAAPGALVAPVAAHVVYGRPSIADLVAGANVVARARIAGAATALGAAGERRPVVTATPLELLKGDPGPGELRFAQHGHGVAHFEPGTEVLLFLQALGRDHELADLAATSGLRWVSAQEHGAELTLDDTSRPALVDAVRAYVAVQATADPEAARVAWRDLTFRHLRSTEKRLAASALRDLVTRGARILDRASLPAIEPLVDDPAAPIGIRLGVLAELDRLGLVDGPRRWAALLASVEPPALVAVVRAAGAHPSAPVNRRLVPLLKAADADLAEAAAIALGAPGNQAAVAPLAEVLRGGPPSLAMAAIRGLGRIGGPEALTALEAAAGDHPDPVVRRRARAEARRLAEPTDAADDFEDGDTGPEHANDLFIEHSDGTVAQYAHLRHRSFLVQPGECVTAGQPVAESGDTGAGPIPHLHFEVYNSKDEFASLPVSFRNAGGTLDERGGLIVGETYEALPW